MLGKKIKELRKLKKYSQQEMADLLEIKKITYFKYESGEIEVPLSKLLKISEILNTTPNDLLGFEKEIGMKEKKDFYENCLRNDRPTLVQIKENGDKYNDFYYPILKNYLEDIIVFDINGNLYKNTGKYRKLCFQSNIKKIDLYEPDSICFNPLSYLNLENIKDFTDVLVMNCLGERERTNKVKFLSAVIKQFYFEIRIKGLDLDINFKTILDYIRSFGKVKGISISTEFKISNSHKYFEQTDRAYFEKIKLIDKSNYNEQLIQKGQIPEFYKENLELIDLGDEELENIKNEILRDLYIFSNERISFNTRKNELDLSQLKNNETPTSIYFIVDKENIAELSPITRMFYTVLFYEYIEENYNGKLSSIDKRMNKKNILVTLEELCDEKMSFLGKYIKYFQSNSIKFIGLVNENYFGKNELIDTIAINSDLLEISDKKIEYSLKKSGLGNFKEVFTNGNIEVFTQK